MSGFNSEAAAYIVGILVGAAAGIAILALMGWYLYRRMGIGRMAEDEELQALRRVASTFEEPSQADRNEPALRPSTSTANAGEEEDEEDEEMVDTSHEAASKKRPSVRTAAVAATVASKRKQAWRM